MRTNPLVVLTCTGENRKFMIKIPELFEQVLANSPELSASVRQNIKLFEPWLEQSGMPFFPGFTDHSPRHINDVLDAAASLISDESHNLLTAEDVAVLCIAALLHDCGMHLTQDGFRVLIENSGPPIVSGFGDQPWSQLWKDFVAEARRFGQDKLVAICGDAEPIRLDEINYENLSERDYLLIGEFVRRHHARLAHEIAIEGVPSRNDVKLELTGFDTDLRDLAGLVARSHGMSIRSTFYYIEERYSLLPEQRGVKSPFLMAVLRIADYVQVQSERALKSLLSVKELRSPISRQEWRNHFAVKNISHWHSDPESFFVDASPTDVKTYLKLVTLFKDIQRELDASWATIGEVYGRLGKLGMLGLTMRRIRSNLDSPEKFSRTVPYIPIKAGFDTSGPDLLKLLVGPLYDYKYEVGIRELIQNAVDACRELSDFSSETPSIHNPSDQEPDVQINIQENEDGTGWITVTDKGVGMTLETITNYFLIAGASFRNSDLWKRQHIDEFGQPRVMRGGRFGVGALASFLLGDEIAVTTRHFKRAENEGIEFNARIDEPNIELRRCVAPAGTSIKIWVSDPKVMIHLRPSLNQSEEPPKADILLDSWATMDWFLQSSPGVEYRWNGYKRSVQTGATRVMVSAKFTQKKENFVPLSGTTDPSWKRLANTEPYKDIYWKYVAPVKQAYGNSTWMHQPNDEVTVNGIRVQAISAYIDVSSSQLKIPEDMDGTGPAFRVRRPSLAIFDPDGKCPINLQRSSVAFDRMGMDFVIAKDVLSKHLRHLIRNAQSSENVAEFYKLSDEMTHSRDVVYEGLASPICATSNGIFLATPNAFMELEIRSLYFASASHKSIQTSKLANTLQEDEALIFRHAAAGIQNDLAWFRGILSENTWDNWNPPAAFPRVLQIAAFSIIPLEKWEFANKKGKVRKEILKMLKSSSFDANHIEARSGNHKRAEAMLPRCKSILNILGDDAEIGGWILGDDQKYANEKSLLNEIWLDITGGTFLVEFRNTTGK